jgi:hypothetical protein
MKVIVGPSGSGKTERLIRLANATGSYVVVRSKAEATRLSKLDLDRFPITFAELLAYRRGRPMGRGVERMMVDGVDALLRFICERPVDGVTFDEGEVLELPARTPKPARKTQLDALSEALDAYCELYEQSKGIAPEAWLGASLKPWERLVAAAEGLERRSGQCSRCRPR